MEYNSIKPSLPLLPINFWLKKNWFKMLLAFLALYLYFNRDISIQFNMVDKNKNTTTKLSAIPHVNQVNFKETPAVNTSKLATKNKENSNSKGWKDRKANNFYNITFVLSPDYGKRKGIDPAIVEEKLFNCNSYVSRFAPIAITEMERYKIPASITLAQGLLESDAGKSRLAEESNNHFGIKCKSKCKGCTCRNYTDDDIYDMFRVFESVWESYREHSVLLSNSRYKHLKNLGTKDYKGWAHGLKKAGYATDKRYAYKLIKIIEEMELYKYDA